MARRYDPRPHRPDKLSTAHHDQPSEHQRAGIESEVALDCGWGRLIFGQTFVDQDALHKTLLEEQPGRRDIAIYLRDPHVLVGQAPGELFIDPSLSYRLWLHRYRPRREPLRGLVVRQLESDGDAAAVNRIYAANGMVTADEEVMWRNQRTDAFVYLVASDIEDGTIIGTITGINHAAAFGDPEDGSSFWCLAVDPQAPRPGVGEALVRFLAERFHARGLAYLDCSVLHDNEAAIGLYTKLGFERVPVFAVKRKNPINEPLFAAQPGTQGLNPYAQIIADEAHRRGVSVKVLDAPSGLMRLTYGGRTVTTRESLSELTTAVAMMLCDDKRLTRDRLRAAGLRIPSGRLASFDADDVAFLEEHDEVVVKPVRGEQGRGVTVGVRTREHLYQAIDQAERHCPQVLIEACHQGHDLRVVVIDHEVAAAAVRRPAEIVGTGRHTIADLIAKQSRRRAAATGGESTIPLDDHTYDTVAQAGYAVHDILPDGEVLQVRRTANLHTGGTIHDVTGQLSPDLADVAVAASKALDIPVVGVDLLVAAIDGSDYVVIEANERPGLANHEPQPTAQRFLDLLFPRSRRTVAGVPHAR